MANYTTDVLVAKLEERVTKLEQLAPHHRAHLNALEALLLQVLPKSGVNDDKVNSALAALLPNQPEPKQSAFDRTEVLLGIHSSNVS